jgi:hypothetical protein
VLVDRRNLKHHLPWMALCLGGGVAACAWYAVAASASHRWPGGSSLPGMVFGIVGALIILFEFLLWPRKWVRGWRLGSARLWMRAHIWLGLLSLPLVVLHTGWTLGGSFTTLLLGLYLAVIASGVFGLLVQQFLPRLLLDEVPVETIASQIDVVARQHADDAEEFITRLCGPRTEPAPRAPATVPEDRSEHVVIGAVRQSGHVRGRVLQTESQGERILAPELRSAFDTEIKPYLIAGERGGSLLADRRRARLWFDDLESHLGIEAKGAVDALRTWCDQRRQFELQRRLHFWLHSWLGVHLPLSVALVLLLAWHIFTALKYW